MQRKIYLADDLNSSEFGINIENGIFDLRTHTLIPHNPDFLFSKVMNASYLPDADLNDLYEKTYFCKVIKNAINNPDRDKQENDFLFKSVLNVLGYLMIKGNPKRKIPIIVGPTATGKSLIVKVLNEIFGSYAGSAAASTFMKTRRSESDIRPELVKNADTRILTVVETDQNTVFDTVLLKSMSGSDQINFRRPYKSTVTFRFQGTIIFLTNFIPHFSNIEDAAFLDRILSINFRNTVPEDKRDVYLDKKLFQEKDKILTLLLYHASLYYASNEQIILSNEMKINKEKLILERSNLPVKFMEDKLIFHHEGQPLIGQRKYSKAFIYDQFYQYCIKQLKIEKIPTLRAFFDEFDKIMEYHPGVRLKKSSSMYYTGFDIDGAPQDPTYYGNLINDILEDRFLSQSSNQKLINASFTNMMISEMSHRNSPRDISDDEQLQTNETQKNNMNTLLAMMLLLDNKNDDIPDKSNDD